MTKETWLVSILHNHNGEFGTTVGKIELETDEPTEHDKQRVEAWIERKEQEHKCKEFGDQCSLDIREAFTGLKSTMLAMGAEPIP